MGIFNEDEVLMKYLRRERGKIAVFLMNYKEGKKQGLFPFKSPIIYMFGK